MVTPPIILVPGFWLGEWAWDDVAAALRAHGHDVTAMTLPGLEALDVDRSAITLADHVQAIADVVAAAGRPVVLVVHSGAAVAGYALTDRVPERIAAVVYVDAAPPTTALDPEFSEVEFPLPPWPVLEEQGNSLDGLTDAQLATFAERAVPQPGATLREAPELTNDARLAVPTTVICTSITAEQAREAVREGYPFAAGLAELRAVDYVDVPTSHWPMWSRPLDLAQAIADVAARA